MSSADIWTNVDDMLPEPGSDVVMVWAEEKAIRQGKFFGEDSSLHGFATLDRNGKHYVGKIFVTHWCYTKDLLEGVK